MATGGMISAPVAGSTEISSSASASSSLSSCSRRLSSCSSTSFLLASNSAFFSRELQTDASLHRKRFSRSCSWYFLVATIWRDDNSSLRSLALAGVDSTAARTSRSNFRSRVFFFSSWNQESQVFAASRQYSGNSEYHFICTSFNFMVSSRKVVLLLALCPLRALVIRRKNTSTTFASFGHTAL